MATAIEVRIKLIAAAGKSMRHTTRERIVSVGVGKLAQAQTHIKVTSPALMVVYASPNHTAGASASAVPA